MYPDFNDIGLLIIDVQERLVPAMPQDVVSKLIRNIDLLAELVLEYEGSVVYSEQYPKGLGRTVEPLLARLSKAQRFEKISFSCLGEETFAQQILPTLPSQLIVVGMETHVCVLQTIMDLVAEGFEDDDSVNLFVPVDAVCSRSKLNWQNALDQMADLGITLTNTETLIFQALGDARHERFKHYSQRLR
ncbi:MAG: isochorismatase family protein [Myxococcota bacterium]|jgi:nicotinamidase-related amidase|nr:isochorismatase family protein [Myxococcota bacterium]